LFVWSFLVDWIALWGWFNTNISVKLESSGQAPATGYPEDRAEVPAGALERGKMMDPWNSTQGRST